MKYIPWAKPKLTKLDIHNVKKTLESNWISGGSEVENFEDNLKKFLRTKYVCVTNNGTSAIHLALLSINLKINDEIIVPGYGYMAAANIAKLMNLRIKFADVDLKSFCIDLEHIKKIVSKKTKLIVITHTYGNIHQIKEICSYAKRKKILILEDCAESLGSKYENKNCGSFGDIATFSFHATKTITTGEGGAVCTKNNKFFQKMKLFRSHGVKKKRYFHLVPGHNFRLTNFQSALGNSQIKRLNLIKKKRKILYNLYKKYFKDSNLKIQYFSKKVSANIWTFSIHLDKKFNKIKRDKLINKLTKLGIETRNGFYCSNELKYFREHKLLINSKSLSDRVINLPLFEELKVKEVKYIVTNFLKLYADLK